MGQIQLFRACRLDGVFELFPHIQPALETHDCSLTPLGWEARDHRLYSLTSHAAHPYLCQLKCGP